MNTLFEQRETENTIYNKGSGIINVYTDLEKSEILGFGGAFTEAAAYNYHLAGESERKRLLEKYFSKEKGLGYNLGRLHIGSCDFSIEEYSLAYKEDLSDFNIENDKKYIIPFVKDALAYTGGDIFLFASPWSPPAFMKDNLCLTNGGKLKKEFYPLYAEYFVKFLNAYKNEGIKICAVTIQNEACAVMPWESCQWTGEEEALFAVENLRPALDKNGLGDVKIILWDHNRDKLLDRARESFAVKGAMEAVWGMGFHWYTGTHFNAIDLTKRLFPDKILLETEFCNGRLYPIPDELRYEKYAVEYCQNINHGTNGLCDWNLVLDSEDGGPCHSRDGKGCFSPLYFDKNSGTFIEDGIYDIIGTFTKYIDKGDVSVETTTFNKDIYVAAIKKKDGRIFAFIVNLTNEEKDINLRVDGKKTAIFKIPARSVSANEIM